nr:MAG TPA: hypothetical protein [Caudoviricetes sp.]DAN31168.1 MAG TPA: hypothetical protein [Caudoviricetes sp.]
MTILLAAIWCDNLSLLPRLGATQHQGVAGDACPEPPIRVYQSVLWGPTTTPK